tara:strand:+ start:166 stop:363 length:198 start_codon:yes stop_codon:yes gene_type:complete
MRVDKCARCGKECGWVSMSFLNTQMCCDDCLTKERDHPKYKAAKEEEAKQVKAGNYNYNPNITVS